MCFSATASFTASAALAIAGIATLKQARNRSQLFLASIPLLFAIQQFSEGVLWLTLPDQINTPIGQAALYTFLFFAVLFWPIWIPLSGFAAEKIQWRKYVLGALTLAGIVWSVYYFLYATKMSVSAQIANGHIQYVSDFPSNKWYYAGIILASCFVSSFPRIWIFGVLVAISLVVSYVYFEPAFGSVWCFFAALLSLILYKVMKEQDVPVSTDAVR